jgi:hypothetical protein
VNVSGVSPTIIGSHNFSGVTRIGLGDYALGFTNPLASATYGTMITINMPGLDYPTQWVIDSQTTFVRVAIGRAYNLADYPFNITIVGG